MSIFFFFFALYSDINQTKNSYNTHDIHQPRVYNYNVVSTYWIYVYIYMYTTIILYI